MRDTRYINHQRIKENEAIEHIRGLWSGMCRRGGIWSDFITGFSRRLYAGNAECPRLAVACSIVVRPRCSAVFSPGKPGPE